MPEKTEPVQFYVTADTKKALRIAAAEREQSMAEFARSAIHGELEGHGVTFPDE